MSLSNDKNELVLIDSDSDNNNNNNNNNNKKNNNNNDNELPNKRIKLDNSSQQLSITPFKEVSSEEDNASNDYESSSDSEKEANTTTQLDSENGLSMPSFRILPHNHNISQQDDSDISSSESDLEPTMLLDDIPPDVIIKTRKQLKKLGSVGFLEAYLPTAASVEDIIKLILKLGYVPRNLPDGDSDILEFIKILNQAMIKVLKTREQREDVTTIEDVLKLLQTSEKILVITGAGISTSLGIPDFRSSQGFYSMVQHLGLSDPQEVFDLEIFHTDPSLFYSIAHMILPPEPMFSPLHSFIKLLQDKNKLLRNYTQNIDNLESYAGINKDKLIQCHGSFATASCITCKNQIEGESIFQEIRDKQILYCPDCTKRKEAILKKNEDAFFDESYGVYKPDITFFGEPLPKTFHDHIREDLFNCDLLISIGTSLKVAPVADIVEKVPENVPQILINRDPINHCNFDVSLLGYCDDVASYISNKLGNEWNLPHEKYNDIRGDNGDNLSIEIVNESLRQYKITNKLTQHVDPEEVIEHELMENNSTIEHTPLGEALPPSSIKDNTPKPVV
ncbi:unnamed protein product [Candida verbasci]|uniref:Deacetylase sirtuin-type domain-containing protein n=1 Tax=Candida verbasci TaxID=1227364 RepID=A0A9W4XFU9_9ASCO|nr:unnamed protein product [Candida verbasci]